MKLFVTDIANKQGQRTDTYYIDPTELGSYCFRLGQYLTDHLMEIDSVVLYDKHVCSRAGSWIFPDYLDFRGTVKEVEGFDNLTVYEYSRSKKLISNTWIFHVTSLLEDLEIPYKVFILDGSCNKKSLVSLKDIYTISEYEDL